MEALLEQQSELRGRISRVVANLKKTGVANLTVDHVQAALAILEKRWAKFEENHDKLGLAHGKELRKTEYYTNDHAEEMEMLYTSQRAALMDLGRSLKAKTEANVSTTVRGLAGIPYLFDSIVGQDPHLSDVQRLHYLKTRVKGEAEQLLRGLPSTDANYERAWSTLKGHYEKKRLLVKAYLSAITSLPKMKADCVADLRRIYHGMVASTQALEGIGKPVSNTTHLLVHLMVELLDAGTRREWENSIAKKSDPPSFDEFKDFLEEQLVTHESLRSVKGESSSGKSAHHTGRQSGGSERSCVVCKQNHFIMNCEKFRRKPAKERLEVVTANRLCINCMGRHQVSACSSPKACARCAARHNTLLHDAYEAAPGAVVALSPSVHAARHPHFEPPQTLLATARVLVTDRFGTLHAVRALMDPGSETSLITEALAQRLRLPRTTASVAIYGVGGLRSGVSRGRIAINLTSRVGDAVFAISALVMPRLSIYGGSVSTDPVELLLGVDVYAKVARPGMRLGGDEEPIAQQTALGWIIMGPVSSCQVTTALTSLQCSAVNDLNALVRRFWELEEPPRATLPLSPDDAACEEHYLRSHSRDASGRYVVRFATRSTLPDLRDTRFTALRVLQANEHRFRREVALRDAYSQFLAEYLELGHMTPAPPLPADCSRACFLPHHGVWKGDGEKARIRVVFNGSSRTSSGTSLNGELLAGPNLLPTLCDVITRWRKHQFVLAADIEKIYRQIWVHPEDRDLQRIYWKIGSRVQEFHLNTVTYGLASAPYLAVRTLRQLAKNEGARFPRAAEALRRDTYVDDVLSGASSQFETCELREQLTQLCLAGGFRLRKWVANKEDLLRDIPAEHRSSLPSTVALTSEEHDVLGIRWLPAEDSFAPTVKSMTEELVTKRTVLRQTAHLFDPLGWLTRS
ncbi:uncharacterized protein LOC105205078 [Solenopsis invicta]|uniref:uncharacterized protein LOC105205078 n=1 Tax=Solenopsis invicta TaxID=13686 RepID=UPI00193D098C|nr:uncharacterized protein LOC105205078 [Solenopsis invicta]